MKKEIHVNSKIFFADPFVIRVDHTDVTGLQMSGATPQSFLALTRKIYKNIKGTWGVSKPRWEQVSLINKDTIDPTLSKHQLNLLYGSNFHSALRSYWCFKNELDVLQFKLMLDRNAVRVLMWPECNFTIHEIIE